MKLSIQRGCDGNHDKPEETCDTRLDVFTEVADRVDPRGFQAAWVSLAVALGWRRFGAVGTPESVRSTSEAVIVPNTRTWIMCPSCVAKGGYVCADCGQADCRCDAAGGRKTFDVVKP